MTLDLHFYSRSLDLINATIAMSAQSIYKQLLGKILNADITLLSYSQLVSDVPE